jgi:hypothetical protein
MGSSCEGMSRIVVKRSKPVDERRFDDAQLPVRNPGVRR